MVELIMIRPAPNKVKIFGISPQIKYPNRIAKTKFKYLVGVTKDASAILRDTVRSILAIEPMTPVKIKSKRSTFEGVTQPKGKVQSPTTILSNEK